MLQRRERWMYRLLEELVQQHGKNDATRQGAHQRPWLELLDPSSANYLSTTTVKYAKVDMYHYQMAASLRDILWEYWRQFYHEGIFSPVVTWWNRTYSEPLIPAVKWDAEQSLLVKANNIPTRSYN